MDPFYIAWLKDAAAFLSPYAFEIAIAQISTILVMYGDGMNKKLKNALRKQTVVVRFSVYILFNAFVIGIMTLSAAKILSKFYISFPHVYLLPVLIATFLALGVLAISRKQI